MFTAALLELDSYSLENLVHGKRILHFAPEDNMSDIVKKGAAEYTTTDFLLDGYDLKLDMSDMPEVPDGRYDLVLSMDVLEHVPDFRKSLQELYRILSPGAVAILTAPQKDGLKETYENPDIKTPEDRLKHFGQVDHLRIFGEDLPRLISQQGFEVEVVDESSFSTELREKFVLSPAHNSKDPLATNFRKVFFCRK